MIKRLSLPLSHINMCLLFQLWQCGGIMVDAPCSRVGHIYRKFAPFPNPGVGDFIGRVSTIWFKLFSPMFYGLGADVLIKK